MSPVTKDQSKDPCAPQSSPNSQTASVGHMHRTFFLGDVGGCFTSKPWHGGARYNNARAGSRSGAEVHKGREVTLSTNCTLRGTLKCKTLKSGTSLERSKDHTLMWPRFQMIPHFVVLYLFGKSFWQDNLHVFSIAGVVCMRCNFDCQISTYHHPED